MINVTCGDCGHDAELAAPTDAWKCNCHAGVGPDDCECNAVNKSPGIEDNSNDPAEQEVAALQARLLELSGGVGPKGEPNA